MNPPYRLSDADTSVRDFASSLGEHSREILAEAGYSATEIDRLIASGAAA